VPEDDGIETEDSLIHRDIFVLGRFWMKRHRPMKSWEDSHEMIERREWTEVETN